VARDGGEVLVGAEQFRAGREVVSRLMWKSAERILRLV
jgi:hypothetical protein